MAPLPAAEALALVLAEVGPSPAEPVPLAACAGRVSAEDVFAAAPIPAFDNSAMDGFALRSADAAEPGTALRLAGESRAGHPAARGPGPGEALRISTGAALPPGADAVVPLEEALEEDGKVVPAAPVAAGANVRRAGEDLEAGALALPAGTLLGSAEVGVLASAGVAELACARRPSLAVLTSGDELRAPGEATGPGAIYDANRFSLVAAARDAGAEAGFAGALPDELEATRTAIAAALGNDFVVISGGVSVGRHDHVKEALAGLGVEQLFWRVAVRPGGPTWGGVLRRPGGRPALVFGLPGNPVSSLVTFRLFAQPAVLAALGRDPHGERTVARLAADYPKQPGRAHYLRCTLRLTPSGWEVEPTRENQGSHVLTSMLGARCLAVMPAERELVRAGEEVEVLML